MVDYSTIAARLAAALLNTQGEISLAEIRALPLVDDDDVALAIADILARDFELTRDERPAGRMRAGVEDVLRLLPTEA